MTMAKCRTCYNFIWNLRTKGQGRWMIIQCRLSRFRLKSDQLQGVTLKRGCDCNSAQENRAIGRNNIYIWCITYISGRRRAREGIEESLKLLRHHESEVSILSGLGCSLVHVLSLNCKETGKMNSFPCKPQRTRSRMKSGPEIKM